MPESRSAKSLCTDPEQPRKHFDESELLALGQNMKQHGQQVPLIVYGNTILDGERRWRAAQLVDMTELYVHVLANRPTPAELRILQISLDAHRSNLTAMERSDFLARIKQENNWSISELAERLNLKQPLVTKLLSFQAGCKEVRAALQTGRIDQDKAYTICQESDHDKQRELLRQAGDLNREQLRQKARASGQPVELKASVARFPLPTGISITIQGLHGRKITLAGAIDAFLEVAKELRKGQAQKLGYYDSHARHAGSVAGGQVIALTDGITNLKGRCIVDAFAGFTVFAMGVMASVGLFLSGIAAIRQARLAKRLFNLRCEREQREPAQPLGMIRVAWSTTR